MTYELFVPKKKNQNNILTMASKRAIYLVLLTNFIIGSVFIMLSNIAQHTSNLPKNCIKKSVESDKREDKFSIILKS